VDKGGISGGGLTIDVSASSSLTLPLGRGMFLLSILLIMVRNLVTRDGNMCAIRGYGKGMSSRQIRDGMPYTHPLSCQNCRKDDAEPFLRRRWTCRKKGNKRIAQCVEHFALRTLINAFQERHQDRYFIVMRIRPPGNYHPFSGSCVRKGRVCRSAATHSIRGTGNDTNSA